MIDKSKLQLNVLKNTCINCASKIKNIQTKKGNHLVIDPNNGESIDNENSCCHPLFIPKYSTLKDYRGTIIILSLGIAKFAFDIPGFFNSEEICIKCQKSPGHKGCHAISTEYQYKSMTLLVKHKCNLEIRQLEN